MPPIHLRVAARVAGDVVKPRSIFLKLRDPPNHWRRAVVWHAAHEAFNDAALLLDLGRSEERRVGKECSG